MPLLRTTSVPPADPKTALSQPTLKLIVQKNPTQLLQLADDHAQNPVGCDRQVFDVNPPRPFTDFTQIKNLPTDLTNVIAIAVSAANEWKDSITASEVIDHLRVELAFANADA